MEIYTKDVLRAGFKLIAQNKKGCCYLDCGKLILHNDTYHEEIALADEYACGSANEMQEAILRAGEVITENTSFVVVEFLNKNAVIWLRIFGEKEKAIAVALDLQELQKADVGMYYCLTQIACICERNKLRI